MSKMSKQQFTLSESDYREIAKEHKLNLVIEHPLQGPLLPIVNLKVRSLSLVSRNDFCKEQSFIWTDDVRNAAPPTREEKQLMAQAQNCSLALLQTDYGFGVTNLTALKEEDCIGQYEGVFDNPLNPSKNYAYNTNDNTYTLDFLEKDKCRFITGKKYRGFGAHLQHLPDDNEIKAYEFNAETGEAAKENISMHYSENRIFLKAKFNIPPLYQLGFSYSYHYWCGRNESPALFNLKTSLPIPKENYKITRYFIRFIDEFSRTQHKFLTLDDLKEYSKCSYINFGDIILKSEHFNTIRDEKSGEINPSTMYFTIRTPGMTSRDYLLFSNNYFSIYKDYRASPIHIEQIIRHYQTAQALARREKNSVLYLECKSKILAYKAELQILTSSSPQDLKEEKNKFITNRDLVFRTAAAEGKINDLKNLLLLGANVNSQELQTKRTALHQAIIRDQLSAFLFLIYRADVNIKDYHNKTPTDYLQRGSRLYDIWAVISRSPREKPLDTESQAEIRAIVARYS